MSSWTVQQTAWESATDSLLSFVVCFCSWWNIQYGGTAWWNIHNTQWRYYGLWVIVIFFTILMKMC